MQKHKQLAETGFGHLFAILLVGLVLAVVAIAVLNVSSRNNTERPPFDAAKAMREHYATKAQEAAKQSNAEIAAFHLTDVVASDSSDRCYSFSRKFDEGIICDYKQYALERKTGNPVSEIRRLYGLAKQNGYKPAYDDLTSLSDSELLANGGPYDLGGLRIHLITDKNKSDDTYEVGRNAYYEDLSHHLTSPSQYLIGVDVTEIYARLECGNTCTQEDLKF